ncbi:MAG: adenylosuccinate synthase, partial [Chitinispirillaceae bacterium]|nr:adenylosuccinate synthase [Chitinispirillaceae bacterium]
MSNSVIIGAQWGDEGKAKVIDYLAKRSDYVIRFQGGANAGHTVIANGRKFVFHMVPSGIMYPETICIVGNGVVFDAEQFLNEVDELNEFGFPTENRIFVSELAHLVMPYHKLIDKLSESKKGEGKIGTTGRGIGPAYADKANRRGIRVGELRNFDRFVEALKREFEWYKRVVTALYAEDFYLSLEEIIEDYSQIQKRILPFIDDTSYRLFEATKKGKRLLFEGAQGTFLDIDHGTYPYVTSIATAASTGSGIAFSTIQNIIGIVKTYTTRVGNGPFPTEADPEKGEFLRKEGGEYGATTGRPRRCGWFDSVMLRKAIQLNGFTHLALTKLDVLNKLDEIPLCTHYEIDGKKVEQFPADVSLLT